MRDERQQRERGHEEHQPRPPGARLARSSISPKIPARRERRSPWRATHSSCPIAGPDGAGGRRARSYLLDPRLAEQARGPEQHEQDQHEKTTRS